MRVPQACLGFVALLGVTVLVRAEGPPPEPHTALVVGNADYSYGPLRNPINDAEAVAKALDQAGFEVTLQTDADQAKMGQAIRAFGDELKAKGGVGLFYFSGHARRSAARTICCQLQGLSQSASRRSAIH
jgi:uncharacterized caspase-like protein